MNDAARQFYVDLGKQITKIRKIKKMRQTDVATPLGITQSAFSQHVRGACGWSVYQLVQIAEILNVLPIDLLPEPYTDNNHLLCQKRAIEEIRLYLGTLSERIVAFNEK